MHVAVNTVLAHRSPLPVSSARFSRSQPRSRRKVLLVGQHSELLLTRAAIVRNLGAEVKCCSARDAMEAMRFHEFTLVVLCHSVGSDRGSAIARKVHESCPAVRVMQLLPINDPYASAPAGADVVCVAEPYRLAKRLSELLVRAH